MLILLQKQFFILKPNKTVEECYSIWVFLFYVVLKKQTRAKFYGKKNTSVDTI